MSSYAKFLKDILSKKRRLEDHETLMLTKECSAIIQNKLPSKLKDPKSFTIPCNIGNVEFTRALCDLGASINLMPLSVFRKLELGDIKPASVSLQLVDRSVTYPRGIIEDVLVKMDESSIDLGCPFLANGNALIDVHEDFMGSFPATYSNHYILVAVDYVSKCKERKMRSKDCEKECSIANRRATKGGHP
ncbi:hypothetical protein P3X46_018469 [Hevea brasiliensis]|uniref:Aspartic peptidase DDI1-type domain-containing protein n=1 Tax=Hevea brasiliensis TaxID=3981 RepID=A0ABQ9LS49_HEVBR|nr:hypothetical protein P3X46_018469 [Hevea brasiliensis]